MYFPYLRGKQFELFALREFCIQQYNEQKIIPIIEPVKGTFNNMNTAVKTMFENNFKFALILNPHEGEFAKKRFDILAEVEPLKKNNGKWIPAFIVSRQSLDEINSSIQQNEWNEIMLVFKGSIDVEDKEIENLLNQDCVRYVVYGDSNSRSAKRYLDKLEPKKLLIRLDTNFVEQKKNADYLSIPEEKFTEEHRFYKDDNFHGFSDYITLSKDFNESGMLPYAIAIHFTYKKNEEEIWVRHFVSDTNDDQSNIQGKFFEAAKKVKVFFRDKSTTQAITELISMVDNERYPGLGILKKISIKNHLELIQTL